VRRSKVQVDQDHGLWDFLPANRANMSTPEELNAHGRGWTVPELRNKDWDDLHRLWWVCLKERNRIQTILGEMQRIERVYGEVESANRDLEVRKTMKSIKHVLTERWYAWENARVAAMEDDEVDLYADPAKGEKAYLKNQQNDEVCLKFTVENQGPFPLTTCRVSILGAKTTLGLITRAVYHRLKVRGLLAKLVYDVFGIQALFDGVPSASELSIGQRLSLPILKLLTPWRKLLSRPIAPSP